MKVAVIGCGGHGRVILDVLKCMGKDIAGFLDDNKELSGKSIDGTEFLGATDALYSLREKGISGLVIGIGDNFTRARFFEMGIKAGFEMINVIHPSAVVSKNVTLGSGIVIMAGVVINTGVKIGDNVCINTGAIVDHDNILADHVHIYPGAKLTGSVTVGSYSYIGTNAAVNPQITIGANVCVGTGTVVISNLPDNVTAAGVPARIIKRRGA